VGANQAPDIIEQGRGTIDLVLSHKIRRLGLRVGVDNLTDADYRFTQTLTAEETQRLYKLGRTFVFSASYNVF
jgi:outer membrane receptor protein involved in Fe transport